MSAVRARGVCPLRARGVRFRNRHGAVKGLDKGRQACRREGIPEALWPAKVYRCRRRDHGGCGGWHLASDPAAVHAFLAGTNVDARALADVDLPPDELPAAA